MKEKSTAVQNERKANRRISCLLIRKGRGAQFCKKRVKLLCIPRFNDDLKNFGATIIYVNGYKQFTVDCITPNCGD